MYSLKYGKAFRKISKPQLVNSINQKELVTEIDFSIGAKNYQIRRGIKPNFMEISLNGKLVDQDAAVRDYQSYLETNILKLNYKSFTQIVILGSATYVPFMELPAHGRREIIEDLLIRKILLKHALNLQRVITILFVRFVKLKLARSKRRCKYILKLSTKIKNKSKLYKIF